jgi:hypothetical protein
MSSLSNEDKLLLNELTLPHESLSLSSDGQPLLTPILVSNDEPFKEHFFFVSYVSSPSYIYFIRGCSTNIFFISEELIVYYNDTINQLEVIRSIIATSLPNKCSKEAFNKTPLTYIKLSKLKAFYERKDPQAANILSHHHNAQIDDDF